MQFDVSIIIVNWNTRDVLYDCVLSVYDQTRDVSFEVILIDNASTDGSVEMVQNEFPQVQLIINQQNRGFAAANNQGIKIARGRYVLLLNPDTIVLDRAIEKTVAFADEHPDIGIIGCQVWESQNTIQKTCFTFPSLKNLVLLHSGFKHLFPKSNIWNQEKYGSWDRTTEREVDVVSGMFMLVRQAAIQQVGLMDENYFVYAEETDWCYRFWKNGWRCYFTPTAKILHLDGGSKSTEQISIKMYVQQQKSLLIYYKKKLGWPSWLLAKFIYCFSMLIKTIFWGSTFLFRKSEKKHHKMLRSAAALKYHLLGIYPI